MTNQPNRFQAADEASHEIGNSSNLRVLDVRPAEQFVQGHRLGSVNIPLEDIESRIYELPPRHQTIIVFDVDDSRAQHVANLLRIRERDHVEVASSSTWLASGPIEVGPSKSRLWTPHSLLMEAADIARERWGQLARCTAIDLACGTGRDAVYLAMQEFQVSAVDNLPDALERCSQLADRNSVSITTVCHDLERDSLPEGETYHLVSCFNYLHRPLMEGIARVVHPGGMVVYETFTTTHRDLFGKPKSDEHLLRRDELSGYFSGWEIVVNREGLASERRHVASLIAIKPQ